MSAQCDKMGFLLFIVHARLQFGCLKSHPFLQQCGNINGCGWPGRQQVLSYTYKTKWKVSIQSRSSLRAIDVFHLSNFNAQCLPEENRQLPI